MNHLEEIIHESMGSRWADVPVQALSETDSTNTRLKEWAREGRIAAPYVLTADSQTAGRGRLGRSFLSPPGTGLYMSLLAAPSPGMGCGSITILAAVAVCRAIEETTRIKPWIKWVNDLFVRGKKVCGILSEASYGIHTGKLEYVVVGIGINAYEPSGGFPSAIADIAGSVFDEPSTGLKNRLAAEILNRMMAYYQHLSEAPYSEEYIRRSMVTGKDVMVHKDKEIIPAHVLGIDEEFGLKVRYEDGSVEILRSGEVSIRI